MTQQPTTWAHISGYRFLLRRLERALLRGQTGASGEPLRAGTAPLTIGGVLALVAAAGFALLGVLQPEPRLDHARIVMGNHTGALYVRVGDSWHPVLNLASARLIAQTDADPLPVRDAAMRRTKRGPLLGIPGAPAFLGAPLSVDDADWAICDTAGVTTVVVGASGSTAARRLARDQAVLVSTGTGPPAYLLYNGQRAVVDLADTAVVRALRLEGRVPIAVSQALLNAVPEVPPITMPHVRNAGSRAASPSGFPVGSVLRLTRGDGDEFYAVLDTGVQRIGQVAADLLRFGDSRGSAQIARVTPDALRGAQIVNTLPVATFPDRAPQSVDAGLGGTGLAVCVGTRRASGDSSGDSSGEVVFVIGRGVPLPPGQAPVALAQADGAGPALDGVYLPPGRTAYVRGGSAPGTRYLVTDTGVRFPVPDDDAAHDLGLPAQPVAVPWPILVVLPCGPELSRANASVARDVLTAPR